MNEFAGQVSGPPVSSTGTSLETVFAALPSPTEIWDGRHVLLRTHAGAVTLADMAAGGAELGRLVDLKKSQAKGGDERLGCAYLIGDLGWELGHVLAGLWLLGWRVSAADPAAIALTIRTVNWEEDGATGTSHVIDLSLDPAGLKAGGSLPLHLARVMEELLGGIVSALARRTKLGQAAQWRLVGDGLSAALVEMGRRTNRLDEALSVGRAILGDRTTRLRSPQTEFVHIRLAHRPDVSDWFRIRGGCCRYYTASGESGEYCTTCVLRDRDDQIARLTAWLDESTAPDRVGLDNA